MFLKPLVFVLSETGWLFLKSVSPFFFCTFLDYISLLPLKLGFAMQVSKWASGMLASVMCTSLNHGTCKSSMGDLQYSFPSHCLDVNVHSNFGSHMLNMVKPKYGRCWFSTWKSVTCLIKTPILDFGLRYFVHYSSSSYLTYYTSLHKEQRNWDVKGYLTVETWVYRKV